jgi:hypothetical protein
MSLKTLEELTVRMASEPAFAEQVRLDSQNALAGYDLDQPERAQLAALAGDDAVGAVRLGARQSKSSLFFSMGMTHASAGGVNIPQVETTDSSGHFSDFASGHTQDAPDFGHGLDAAGDQTQLKP